MLRNSRVGLIIWGSILLTISFLLLILIITGLNKPGINNGHSNVIATAMSFVMFLAPFLGGAVMLVFGIVNVVKTTKYNNEIINKNLVFATNCLYCGRGICCTIRAFRPHRNFPEGYVICPFCKKPISKNTFGVYQNDTQQG